MTQDAGHHERTPLGTSWLASGLGNLDDAQQAGEPWRAIPSVREGHGGHDLVDMREKPPKIRWWLPHRGGELASVLNALEARNAELTRKLAACTKRLDETHEEWLAQWDDDAARRLAICSESAERAAQEWLAAIDNLQRQLAEAEERHEQELTAASEASMRQADDLARERAARERAEADVIRDFVARVNARAEAEMLATGNITGAHHRGIEAELAALTTPTSSEDPA